MDSVYSIFNQIASPKVEIGKRFERYHKLLSKKRCVQTKNAGENTIASFMPSSFEQEEFNILAEYCSIDKLTVPDEMEKCDEDSIRMRNVEWAMMYSEIPKDTGLVTLEMREERRQENKQDNEAKYTQYLGETTVEYKKQPPDAPIGTPGKDVLIFIRVYKPVKSNKWNLRRDTVALSNNIVILGFQTLDKFRDLIDCISDLSISKDASENPDEPIGPLAKDVYKSGFFFIEDTFYIDCRDSENQDHSTVIREWATNHGLGPFKTAKMEEVRVDSLKVRFGYPWVYQHQGDCEHLFTFSDARFMNINDELALTAYPRVHTMKYRRYPFCMACTLIAVHWVVTESNRLPQDPFYFCDACFRSYNYIDGKKLGKFKAYVYPCHPNLMRDESPSKTESPKSNESKSKNSPKFKTSPRYKTSPRQKASPKYTSSSNYSTSPKPSTSKDDT